MDYKNRPLEDRIDLATQYASLLMAERIPNQKIISILKSDYSLTDDQAVQIFEAVHSIYNQPQFTELDKKLLAWAVVCMVLLCIFSIGFWSTRPIRDNEIATINDCIVTAPVTKERIKRGKQSDSYYVIWLSGRIRPCHFFDRYYNFSRPHQLDAIHEGDTISVQILKSDLDLFYERYNYSIVDLINIDRGDGFLVNHAARYSEIKRKFRTSIYISLFVLGTIVLILIKRKGIYSKLAGISFRR
jgi:hypothetical protein